MGLFRRRNEDALAKARREAGLEDQPEIGSVEAEPVFAAEPEPRQVAEEPGPAPSAPAPAYDTSPPRSIAEEIDRASRKVEPPKREGRVGPAGPVPNRRR
jgi:hypothetical protein